MKTFIVKRFWTHQFGGQASQNDKIKQQGFTLLEVLLVVAAISILAGIVIVAINPTKQLGNTRDSQRKNDIGTVINAIYQYQIDNGSIPATITQQGCLKTQLGAEICKTNATCAGLTDLSVLTTNEKYLVSLPVDPSGGVNANGTGYFVTKDANSRVTVCAVNVEQAAGSTMSASL